MSSAIVEGPRAFTITSQDRGGIVVLTSTLFMTWILLCLIIRTYNRLAVRASLGLDDLVCGLATVFGVAQTIVACVAVSHGFGKAPSLISETSLRLAEKYILSADMLGLVAIALSKVAMLYFYLRITPQKRQRMACYATAGVCGIWLVLVLAINGSRCGVSHPSELYNRTCRDYASRWIGIAISDSILELVLFTIPVWILWAVRTKRNYKLMILVAFGGRFFLIIAAALHAANAWDWAHAAIPFHPVGAVTPFVWLSVETNYAIMSATFPTLGTFVKSLNTRWGTMDSQNLNLYALESQSSRAKSERSMNAQTGKGRKFLSAEGGNPGLGPNDSNYLFRMSTSEAPDQRQGSGSQATRGSDDSAQMIIRKTVSTRVELG